jgi:acetyl-CoA synthetase
VPESTATVAYRAARDTILSLQGRLDEAVAAFRWPDVGERFNWAVDWFDVIAEGNDKTALVILEEDGRRTERSFAELAARSNQVARFLADQGIGKGDSVLLMVGNQVELWETMLAVMKLGAVIVPTTPALGHADLLDRMERARGRCVVANPADTTKFDEVPGEFTKVVIGEAPGWTSFGQADDESSEPLPHPETRPDDRLLLYFTSGTTSRPKLVEHTQSSYPIGHLATVFWIGLEPGHVHCNISSPGRAKHAYSSFFAPWIAEAAVYCLNYSRFDPPTLLKRLQEDGVTTFCAPPTVWRMLIQADLSSGSGSLRQLVAAGEPLNPEVITQVEKAWGLTIRDGYGQTETTMTVVNAPGDQVKPGSMGRVLPGVPIVLVDPVTGEVGDEGEICIDLSHYPVNLMTGYQGDPERDAEAKAGGYYHSGDVATRDEDGYITYVGRTDDVFKASDYKISPFELESVLIEHPAVVEAAVVPAPDPVRLAVPKAYVSLAEGWDPNAETAVAILRHARENLAPFLRVRRVEFFQLPKTVSGKIRRVELREREQQLTDSGSTSPDEFRDDQFPELKG